MSKLPFDDEPPPPVQVSASAAEGRYGETSPKLVVIRRASEGGPRGGAVTNAKTY